MDNNLIATAQAYLLVAIACLEEYIEGNPDNVSTAHCIVDRLRILVNSEHGYPASDVNLDDLKGTA